MGDLYLDWLPQVVDAALRPLGYDWDYFDRDWLYRARSSGGYDELPLCVMWHHTASSGNAWDDAAYQCYSADAAPVSNITIDPDICLILAGGATNTNGSGSNSPMAFSRGTVAEDDMNRRAVGIEMCNNGTGQAYPQRMIDAMFAVSNAINARCGNVPEDVCSHQHYAPERKVDPAVSSAVQGPWQPGSVTGSGSWDCSDLRAECRRRADAGGTVSPTPPALDLGAIHDEGDTMFIGVKDNVFWIGNGLGRRKLTETADVDFLLDKFHKAGTPLVNFQSGTKLGPADRSKIADVPQMQRLGVVIE